MKQENLIDNFEKVEANLGQFDEIGSLERLQSKNIDYINEIIRNQKLSKNGD